MRRPPFALKGWRGRAVFVGITRENDQVNLFSDGSIYNRIQRFEKIHHAHGQPADGVVLAIVTHVDMGVSKVQNFYHSSIITRGIDKY